MKPTRTLKFAVVRWLVRGFLGGIAVMLGGSACSSPAEECTPPIPPGSRFKVTVIEETAASAKCHIAKLQNEFEIVAAQDDGSRPASSCALTPAMWAPNQQGFTVVTCTPSNSQMLGTNCEMQYPTTCRGLVSFYFYQPPGAVVDWSAPVIHNAVFRIEDTTLGCIPNISGCLDEYKVVLTRL
jgi:hypothetical protein